MKLHAQILLLISVWIILVETVSYVLLRHWILDNFGDLESEVAEKNMARCAAVIENDAAQLAVTVEDWAFWDDTWTFVQDKNDSYLNRNLALSSQLSLNVNLIHIADDQGRRVFSRFYSDRDAKGEKESSISIFSKPKLPPDSPFGLKNARRSVRGIFASDEGLLLTAAKPILRSDAAGPARGTLIMGRLIDKRYITHLAEQTRMRLHFRKEIDRDAPTRTGVKDNINIAVKNDYLLVGTLLLKDIEGRPAGIIQAEIPRKITARGKDTLLIFLAVMIAVGLISLGLFYFFLYLTVVRRIQRLSKQVAAVKDSGATFESFHPIRQDEIGELAVAFQRMIERLDHSRQKEQMDSLLALSGGVAHDLNNILGPAVALPDIVMEDLSELARANHVDITETLDDLEIIASSNRRAAQVIKDLSVMSSVGRIQKAPVLPRVIVWDVLRSAAVTEAFEARPGVKLIQELTSRCQIMGAEGPLSRLVLNLVINAVDAIPQSGTVTVKAFDTVSSIPPFPVEDFADGCFFVLSVSDTGTGIDKRDADRIFEPFFTRKLGFARRGSGLGLAIVKSVVQDFDGKIHVQSEVGVGTEISVLFPCLRDSIPDGPPTRRVSVPTLLSSTVRILVVDDEENQRTLARRILERAGYKVETAADGAAAAARFSAGETFSLIILDMLMKEGFDGLDTFRVIKSHQGNAKVLVASGHAPSDRGAEIISLGAAWMSKPYTAETLLSAVESLLKN